MHSENDDTTDGGESHANETGPNLTRRRFARASAALGLGAAGLGASAPATAQSDGVPSYDQAASELSHPDPAEEAVALYRYLHAEWGERILSGQQHETWGIDEIQHVEDVTGRRPAVKGVDFIHGNARPVDWAMDWWDQGGITKAMWHWGVPGQETPEDPYEQSQNPSIDLQLILEEGTEPNQVFYDELDDVATELQRAGDAGVPLLFGPFHEFEGEWFWWGMEGAEFFVELWETVHEYFVHEWDLDNLIWLLPHMDYPDPNWVPDESTFDLAGADTYDDGDSYQWLYENVTSVHGEDRPIVMHEIGDPGQPPDPEAVAQDGNWWSMWVNWHTDWLENLSEDYLDYVYNHELTVTLQDVPDVVEEYGSDLAPCDPASPEPYLRVDGGERQNTTEVEIEHGQTVQFEPEPSDVGSWSWSSDAVQPYPDEGVYEVTPAETATYTGSYTNECGDVVTLEFTVTVADGPHSCESLPDGQRAIVEGETVCDVNGDGHYRDVTGDGAVGQADVAKLFRRQHREEWKRPDFFDFSENGDVTHGDVVELFDYVALN